MKILYAVQGTGNGHVCRALDIIPALQKKGEVDILISGTQADVKLPFPVRYKFQGLSFIFGKKGGVDLIETYRKSHLRKLLKEIKAVDINKYDLVISDFEPVSSWACYLSNKPCIALSHQAAVMDKKSPQPKKTDAIGKTILKMYAPASVHYGFHFAAYTSDIFTPVIRRQVRDALVENKGHYTVYLPAYSDLRIISILSHCKGVRWQIFSKHYKEQRSVNNIELFPVTNEAFIASMATSEGVLCGAGFETPAEALFLKKKLLVIPMKNQFEQHCNAAALKTLGVPVVKSLKLKHITRIQDWLASPEKVTVDYPDDTEKIIDRIIEKHFRPKEKTMIADTDDYTVSRLRSLTFKKIISKLSN
jgi:uncharacterized protein (TIGR00661 family)